MNVFVLLLLVVIFVVALKFVAQPLVQNSKMEKKLSDIPYSSGRWPVIGHVLEMLNGRPWKIFKDWHKKYGDVIRFSYFNEHYVAINNPAMIQHALNRPHVENFDKDLSRSYGPFMDLLGSGLVTSHGELWSNQRKLLAAVFHSAILEDVANVSINAVDRLSQKIVDSVGTGDASDIIEVDEEFRNLTLEVIGKTILDLDAKECADVFPKLYLPIINEANKRVWYPWRAWMPWTSDYKAYQNGVQQLNTYVRNLVLSRKKKMEKLFQESCQDPTFSDILDRIVWSTIKQSEGKMTEQQIVQIRDEVKTFLFAGHETSSTMLTWAMWELSQHPECMQAVVTEARQVFGNSFPIGTQASSDFNKKLKEKDTLKFTENVLKEVLRKWSVVPAVTREVTSDQVLEDPEHNLRYEIPKGCKLVVSIGSVHSREDLWDNPEEFNPNRFNQKLPHLFAYIPFIQGPRLCLGQPFALLEGKVVLALLALRFEWKVTSKTTGETHPFNIPISPKEGMNIVFSPRK